MRSLLTVVTLLAAGCGGSMFSDQISAYRSTTNSLAAVVDAHSRSSAAIDPATCPAAMADYARQAGVLVDRLQSMSGRMDQCMTSLGRSDRADLSASCAAIRSELDAHAKNGCAAPGLAAEMSRHTAAMNDHTGHELDRMGQMEGMGNSAGSSMMSNAQGCH